MIPTSPPKPLFVPLLDNGNGSVMASFMLDHGDAFGGRDIFMIRASDSHANRGMNKVANAFLDSPCDIWINIDADIRFTRKDIDRLLSHDLPLVYGIYPKKEEQTSPCVCTFETPPVPDANGLVELRRCGRGFMLVKREVLEAMKEDNGGPALRYHNHEKIEWDFFPSGPVTGAFSALDSQPSCKRPLDADGYRLPGGVKYHDRVGPLDPDGFPIREWISEDWYFCERARALGIKTMVDTQVALGHVGPKEYRFARGQLTRTDSNISSWREIEGWFDFEDVYRDIVAAMPDAVNGTPPPVFVEVGAWLGRSIAAFAEFAKEAGKDIRIHAVDTFEGEPANEMQAGALAAHGGNVEHMFRANMAACNIECIEAGPILNSSFLIPTSRRGVRASITVHATSSLQAADSFDDASADAVFIDADHSEAAVLADIGAWLPKVKVGGILAGHDFDEPGVKAAVTSLLPGATAQGRCWIYHHD